MTLCAFVVFALFRVDIGNAWQRLMCKCRMIRCSRLMATRARRGSRLSKANVLFQPQDAPGEGSVPEAHLPYKLLCVSGNSSISLYPKMSSLVMRFRLILFGSNETHLHTLYQMTIFPTILLPHQLPPVLQTLSFKGESIALSPIHAHTLDKTGSILK